MLKTILILGFTITFFTLLGSEILPYLLSFSTGVAIIINGVSTFAFVVVDIWEYIPLTIQSLVYFLVSYQIFKRVLGV